jgi:hypothetical protein
MCATNDIGAVRELQVDCDWTLRSREKYFALLSDVRRLLKEHGMNLSATIRLHQLSQPAPPVDYGALMVYNTADPRRLTDHNPILDIRDVEPYMKHLKGSNCRWPRPTRCSAGNCCSTAQRSTASFMASGLC